MGENARCSVCGRNFNPNRGLVGFIGEEALGITSLLKKDICPECKRAQIAAGNNSTRSTRAEEKIAEAEADNQRRAQDHEKEMYLLKLKAENPQAYNEIMKEEKIKNRKNNLMLFLSFYAMALLGLFMTAWYWGVLALIIPVISAVILKKYGKLDSVINYFKAK